MSTLDELSQLASREYPYGFVTDIDEDLAPRGLSEEVIRLISAKKDEPDWLLDWRLRAYRHWLTLSEPTWQNVTYGPVGYGDIIYYAAPKAKKAAGSLDEVDPELRAMFDKLGISLAEQERLSGVAVDAVVDSVSVATTFQAKLAEAGVIFCSFSEAVRRSPRAGAGLPGLGRPLPGQLLRHPQLGRVHRRLVLLRAQGRALPDGAVHLFPHQCRGDGPVRADPDRGRRGGVR